MSLRLKCPGCGETLEASPGLAGKKAKCQNCGAVIEIPLSSAFVPSQQLAGSPKPAASSPPPKASPAVFSSPPPGSSPRAHVTLDHSAPHSTVDPSHKGESVF